MTTITTIRITTIIYFTSTTAAAAELPFLFAKKLNHGLPLSLRVALIVTAIDADDEMALYWEKKHPYKTNTWHVHFCQPSLSTKVRAYPSRIVTDIINQALGDERIHIQPIHAMSLCIN
jgi:hypothetical protein